MKDKHPQITSYLYKLVDSFNKGKRVKVINSFKTK